MKYRIYISSLALYRAILLKPCIDPLNNTALAALFIHLLRRWAVAGPPPSFYNTSPPRLRHFSTCKPDLVYQQDLKSAVGVSNRDTLELMLLVHLVFSLPWLGSPLGVHSYPSLNSRRATLDQTSRYLAESIYL
jgi:hypothetical protein